MPFSSEAETVIKRILPYLVRRGYDVEKDMSFEDPVAIAGTSRKGFIDIAINCEHASPMFLIEAKRDGTKIASKHKEQALEYGASIDVLLVAVTNGQVFELLNTTTKKPLLLNGTALNRIPSKKDLREVIKQLKHDTKCNDITIATDRALPFRPGLPLSKLNHLIKQCHNLIRKIEKNEEYAFADFSKFMFLKLLEEKWDQEQLTPPYSYTFYELAAMPPGKGDQIRTAINSMIGVVKSSTPYGSVLADPIRLKISASYQNIVRHISEVSFSDCDLDSKGAAFEYFVRATLKGKKLGQYFTPRPLVKLMLSLGRWEQIVNSLAAGEEFRVLDPACGTGGFLVLAMNQCLGEIDDRLKKKLIHKKLADSLGKQVKEDVFYGIDAHEGVACSAKMNMIIAGDGYNNIRCADSLNEIKLVPVHQTAKGAMVNDGKAHLVLTNPPFGTSESESLTEESAKGYAVQSMRGQSLFIQKMLQSVYTDSLIVTVIDEGVLNTASYEETRRHVLKSCRVEMVLQLPEETFKPNKINVKASVLLLRRREEMDEDLIGSLGYEGSGDEVRGFDLKKLTTEVRSIQAANLSEDKLLSGYNWSAFRIQSKAIASEKTARLDVRFWHPEVRCLVNHLRTIKNVRAVKEINTIKTRRGKSPPVAEYVSASEGYALVVKSGSNISKTGELIVGGDYVERPIYEEYVEQNQVLQDGDVLLASTGDGTIGKCCVYRNKDDNGQTRPAVPEGHVTVIRVDQDAVYPEYLCDYLRKGFGHDQLYRIITGSTGMVEVTPDDVDGVLVPPFPEKQDQERSSNQLRKSEQEAVQAVKRSVTIMAEGETAFRQATTP